MGHLTKIFGYIEVVPREHDKCIDILKNYEFDKIYPFTNIFSMPIKGYDFSIISFGGAFKDIDSYWREWEEKFIVLIKTLKAVLAEVTIKGERIDDYSILYIVDIDANKNARVLKYARKNIYETDEQTTNSILNELYEMSDSNSLIDI